MKILVMGAQHSCTRLFTCLLDVHPDVVYVGHLSVPNGPGHMQGPLDMNPEALKKYDYLCLVSRDRSCVNLANARDNGIPLSNDIARQSYGLLARQFQKMIDMDHFLAQKVLIVSYEALVNFRYVYIRQVLELMGLDPNKYPPDQEVAAKKGYKPKSLPGRKKPRWFSADLAIRDSNEKYRKEA